ncbi:hypothetical protein B0H13DRAFT_1856307 [Mycena leptocephala]|nr:hypothetical protein B0H13DRAFT_1856307 [Mycena leptocephala]
MPVPAKMPAPAARQRSDKEGSGGAITRSVTVTCHKFPALQYPQKVRNNGSTLARIKLKFGEARHNCQRYAKETMKQRSHAEKQGQRWPDGGTTKGMRQEQRRDAPRYNGRPRRTKTRAHNRGRGRVPVTMGALEYDGRTRTKKDAGAHRKRWQWVCRDMMEDAGTRRERWVRRKRWAHTKDEESGHTPQTRALPVDGGAPNTMSAPEERRTRAHTKNEDVCPSTGCAKYDGHTRRARNEGTCRERGCVPVTTGTPTYDGRSRRTKDEGTRRERGRVPVDGVRRIRWAHPKNEKPVAHAENEGIRWARPKNEERGHPPKMWVCAGNEGRARIRWARPKNDERGHTPKMWACAGNDGRAKIRWARPKNEERRTSTRQRYGMTSGFCPPEVNRCTLARSGDERGMSEKTASQRESQSNNQSRRSEAQIFRRKIEKAERRVEVPPYCDTTQALEKILDLNIDNFPGVAGRVIGIE